MLLPQVLASTVEVLKLPFTLGGVTFSYWQVFLFVCFGGIIVWAIWRIFN